MNTMNNTCPKCGSVIPSDAPQGLCPKCVLAGAATVQDPEAGAAASTGEIPSLARVAMAFPQLEIHELVGRGGMGFVFKARQPHLDRFVALKLLPDKLARDPRFAERFNREGRVLAKLNHPNIVSVFDFGQTEHFYYLTMEYVDGVNLRQAMQAGRFSPSEALGIVPKICEALQYAHEQGVLHRDIKPENILLDAKGRVKIADFGIAKLVEEDRTSVTLTGTGTALGTPHYMAPEQLEKPGEVDHRADIYSLGVVFYEMLTGELPIGRFAAPSAKTPVSPGVDEVVFRALEKDRERRFQSAGEVKTQVEHLTDAGGGTAMSATPELRARAWVSTLKHTWSALGLQYPRLQKGRLNLWADRLEFVAGREGRSISLREVVSVGLVPAPGRGWWRRAERLAVAFREDGIERQLEFDFQRGLMSSRARAQATAANWVEAVRRNVTVAAGAAPTSAAIDHAFRRDYPGAGLRRAQVALWLGLYAAIVGLILQATASSVAGAFALMVVAILVCHFLMAWRRRALGLRPWSNRPDRVWGDQAGHPGTPPGLDLPAAGKRTYAGRAVAGAVLVGLSLVFPALVVVALLAGYGGISAVELWLALGSVALPGLGGTVLGWVGLSDIREGRGRVRGLPLALFATLTWPLLLLVGAVAIPPAFILVPGGDSGWSRWLGQGLALLLPAGVLTFAVWAVQATAGWAGHRPADRRRGMLKWVFAGLLLGGYGLVLLSRQSDEGPGAGPRSEPVLSTDAIVQTDREAIRVKLRIPRGQAATFEVWRRDVDPPVVVPSLTGYAIAPNDERGRLEFQLEPGTGFPQQTDLPVWRMQLVTEDGATVSGAFVGLGPLWSVVTPGSEQIIELGPGRESDILLTTEHGMAGTNGGSPRVPLSLVVKTHDRTGVSGRTVQSTIVSVGSTNWAGSALLAAP
ncbi:MAG: serine/threonine protein kinase [Verrucomicrobia bacterium]|nr:serine/threonine protein kinase [Verrucomicrobiota bacterium]